MFNAIAQALLCLAPELNIAKVEGVPTSLKAWVDGSASNGWRVSMGAKCQVRHFFAN